MSAPREDLWSYMCDCMKWVEVSPGSAEEEYVRERHAKREPISCPVCRELPPADRPVRGV